VTSQSAAATLRSRYAEQAASDLQENRRRQQELAEKITVLKQEEALLVDILALAERFQGPQVPARLPAQAEGPDESASASPAPRTVSAPGTASAKATTTPAAASDKVTATPAAASDGGAPARGAASDKAVSAKGTSAKGTSAKATTAKATTAKATTARTGKGAAKAAAKGETRQPLLGEIFIDLLREHHEPRLAKELRDELLERYPERTPTPQVVRNTLEALVAKSRIQRHKQQRSVMYSLAGAAQGPS
jgi:hypothetical protein